MAESTLHVNVAVADLEPVKTMLALLGKVLRAGRAETYEWDDKAALEWSGGKIDLTPDEAATLRLLKPDEAGLAHPRCDEMAHHYPHLDVAYCGQCSWQSRMTAAEFADAVASQDDWVNPATGHGGDCGCIACHMSQGN